MFISCGYDWVHCFGWCCFSGGVVMDAEKPEIKIGIIGGDTGLKQALTRALIKIHGETQVICYDEELKQWEPLTNGDIQSLKDDCNNAIPKFDSSPRFCDCLNCRLGKINQCQTFRPVKRGKRK